MGAAAAAIADVVIVTDDNPRSEDPGEIRAALLAGAHGADGRAAQILEVPERAQAIAHAVSIARPGDAVAVLGKGHETGQEVAGVVSPFDDRLVLADALGGGA